MPPQPRQIVVLGAPGTGADALTEQLRQILASHPECQLANAQQPEKHHSFALLMGLDHSGATAEERSTRERLDTALRQQLQALGLPYQVVYGQGHARLNHALLALGLPIQNAETLQAREAAQFDLNRGRTPWSCEKCSDPDCEHRLFTGLLKASPASPSAR